MYVTGFDRGVPELRERFPPEHLGLRLRGQRGDRLVVLLPQVVVDGQKALQQIVGVDAGARRVLRDGGNHASEETVVDLDPRFDERLRELFAVHGAGRFVGRGIAREEADRRVQVLVVAQDEERHPRRRILNADAGAGAS